MVENLAMPWQRLRCAAFSGAGGTKAAMELYHVILAQKGTRPLHRSVAALRRARTASILALCSPAKRRRLVGCGRPSSAVPRFDYRLPRAKRRIVIWLTEVWPIMGSLGGLSEFLRPYSSLFSLPIAVSVVPHFLMFPGFPCAEAACSGCARCRDRTAPFAEKSYTSRPTAMAQKRIVKTRAASSSAAWSLHSNGRLPTAAMTAPCAT